MTSSVRLWMRRGVWSSVQERVMGTALLRRLLRLFGKFFTAPLSLSLLVKKTARGWRQNTNSLVKLIQSGFGGLLGTVGETWAGDSGSVVGPTSASLLFVHLF